MCGIVGLINTNNYDFDLNTLSHRGPDSKGFFKDEDVYLGHTRLAIQDLSENGFQPMFTSDKRYIIVFNGEIYNHNEIRSEYLKNIQFKSNSDTETLLYGFVEYGVEILAKLNGIFAFAIYDTFKKNIFIARDQFGVKPLYYNKINNSISFSSELKALTKLNFDKEINLNAVANYLTYLWSPGSETPFKNVNKLLPGHYMFGNINNINQITPIKYYYTKLDGNYFNKSEDTLINELNLILRKAVERQLLSDVPVGFFLSGGLDSSLIVAIARDLFPEKEFNCFTINIDEDQGNLDNFENDFYYANKVAKLLNVNLNIVSAKIDIVESFDQMIWHLDEPQADPAPLNVFNIAKIAKKMGIKVLLSGTGGDDLFSGYRRHKVLKLIKITEYIPKYLLIIIQKFCLLFPPNNVLSRRIYKIILNINKSLKDQMICLFEWLPRNIVNSLFLKSNYDLLINKNPKSFFLNLLDDIPNEKNILNQMLYWELNSFLVDHNLNYTDKMSMAVGVETRVPFLDKELVEFSQKIHPKYKLKRNETKYLLKKVAEKYLPKDVIYRSKTGFGAPVRKWVIKDLNEIISNKLSKEKIDKRGIFNFNEIKNLILANKHGKIDASYSIWCLLAIESWFEQFVDS